MRKFFSFAAMACFSFSLGLVPSSDAQSRVQNRIQGVISEDGPKVILEHTVSPRARLATDLGAVPGATALRSMTLRFSMTAAQNAALDRLVLDQQNPASPQFHRWLTPEQYASQFGLSAADTAAVTTWLQAQGLHVLGVARGRDFVTISGTAAQVEHAFGTTLHTVSLNGEQHIANLADPTFPAAIAGVVNGITGLNDFRLRPHVHAHVAVAPKPSYTSSISGNHFIAPGDFYTIYGLSPLLANSINGSGVTIAIMGQTDLNLADVAAFRAASGLPASVPTVQLFGPDPGTSKLDVDEAALDLEWSGAAAPAATILYVNSNDVIGGSLTQAVDQNLAPILSISYGDCEVAFGNSNLTFYNELLRKANSFGQTVVAASGDTGATDCDYQATSAVSGLTVSFPASSPYVTAIGGSQFNQAGGSYFSATNDANSGSALSYIPETVWNESAASTVLSSGGGGVSSYFSKPAYQVGPGVPNDFSRDLPDISFNSAAAPTELPYLFCSQGFCTNGFRNASNSLDYVGGTSVPTPAFAGILALLEQKIQTRVGNANPTLYGLANSTFSADVFHDITAGNNASPCVAGSADCPNGGLIGYNAGPGYDLASGWGSVNVFNMINDWLLVTPSGVTGTPATNASVVTVLTSTPSVTAGVAGSLTANVASATQGVATQPTGTVQLLVDNAAVGTATALANGSATLSIATDGLASGGHTVSASYSGDGVFTGSKAATTIDIVSATLPDFVLTTSAPNVTVASGATTAGITFTVSPVNGFTGNVVFTARNASSNLAATPNFSVSPVVISSSTAKTTVFTLVASVPNNVPQPLSQPRSAGLARFSLAGSGIAMAGLLMVMLPRRRSRRFPALVCAMLSLTMLSLSGCGSGGTFMTPTPVTVTKATPGTYTVVVSATSTNAAGLTVSHSSSIGVTVQ